MSSQNHQNLMPRSDDPCNSSSEEEIDNASIELINLLSALPSDPVPELFDSYAPDVTESWSDQSFLSNNTNSGLGFDRYKVTAPLEEPDRNPWHKYSWCQANCNKSSEAPEANKEFREPLASSRPSTQLNQTSGARCKEQRQTLEQVVESHGHAAEHPKARISWTGNFPSSAEHHDVIYSKKLFLGGVFPYLTPDQLRDCFSEFEIIEMKFPECKNRGLGRGAEGYPDDKKNCGHVYMVLRDEQKVKDLLLRCRRVCEIATQHCSYFYRLHIGTAKTSQLEVIPWVVNGNEYIPPPTLHTPHMSPSTGWKVFVGALHGTMNAEALYVVMNELFGHVIYAGLDVDTYKYPIGAGRVIFSSKDSFTKAIQAAFVKIMAGKVEKEVQIDPYLEARNCVYCHQMTGPVCCRNVDCLDYFCVTCLNKRHSEMGSETGKHIQIVRKPKCTDYCGAVMRRQPDIREKELKPTQPYV